MAGIKHFIWYEKYRPKSMGEMVLSEKYQNSFNEYIASGEIPHLLFFGPAGSGKTTIAFILLEALNCSRLVLNASSKDRGIETMRGKVKTFASSMALNNRPKVVFMDEADGMLGDAQRALKNTIEAYASQCRFIFTCNEIDRIDPAIKSRCIKYEFTAFPQGQLLAQSTAILDKENVHYETEDVEKIISQYYPDIRSVVNTLQACSIGGRLDPDAVSKNTINQEAVLDAIIKGRVDQLRVLLSGMANFQFLYDFLFNVLISVDDLTEEEKKDSVSLLAEHMFRDASVANREINFVACCIGLMGVLKAPKIVF